MKKILAIIMLLACFCNSVWATFNGPAVPQPIPFASGGKIYTAYVQTWHPHYAQSQICYYSSDFDQAYAPVISKSGVVYGGLVNTRVLLNPASFGQVWDSTSYNDSGVLCALYYSGGWYGSLGTPTQIAYTQYSWNDWYFNGSYGYDHNLSHNVRAVGIDVRVNETYNFNGQFYLGSYTSGDVVTAGITTPAIPSTILSPVSGALQVVTSDTSCNGTVWCFNQHGTGLHTSSGGIGNSSDTYAWDANLNYPNADTDNGLSVHAIAPDIVAATYAGSTNAGGSFGQVLLMHNHNGHIWWSAYLHLGNITVSVGNNVTENTQLGVVSNTGTGNAHLHFVVYTGDNTNGGLESFNANITER